MRKLPRIGTRVRVPFGFGTAEGMVVDAYQGAARPYVVVVVELGRPDEGTLTVDFPLDEVEPASAA